MPEQPTVSVLTLGCKLNQSDAETIARRLVGGGARVVARPLTCRRGRWQGLTPNYLRVYTRPDWVGDLTNKLLPTRLLALEDEGLSGEPERVGVLSA